MLILGTNMLTTPLHDMLSFRLFHNAQCHGPPIGNGTCCTDADCPKTSYCMNDPQHKQYPYHCHGVPATLDASAPPATLGATAPAGMSKWDTACGSRFDRINTKKLTFGTASGKLTAGAEATLDTSGTTNLHGPFMGGSWSVRVYEEGFSHPVGDYTGDLAKVLSFPDARNTTFAINGVGFRLPARAATGKFQASFTAQDFTHAAYFCVDVYYTLD